MFPNEPKLTWGVSSTVRGIEFDVVQLCVCIVVCGDVVVPLSFPNALQWWKSSRSMCTEGPWSACRCVDRALCAFPNEQVLPSRVVGDVVVVVASWS